jgi:hypothetical protein
MLFSGFFAFIIIAHLYKIIPFLVWFHRFSPYIGERDVPMLQEMYDEKRAFSQLMFSILDGVLFKTGLSFQTIGSLLLIVNIVTIIRTR